MDLLPPDMVRLIAEQLDPLSRLTWFLCCKAFHNLYFPSLKFERNFNDIASCAGRHGSASLLIWASDYFSPSRQPYRHISSTSTASSGAAASRWPFALAGVLDIFASSTTSHKEVERLPPLLSTKLVDTAFVVMLVDQAVAGGHFDFVKLWISSNTASRWPIDIVIVCLNSGDMEFSKWAMARAYGNREYWAENDKYSLIKAVVTLGFEEFFDYLVANFSIPPRHHLNVESDMMYSAAARGGKFNKGNSLPLLLKTFDVFQPFQVTWRSIIIKAIKGGNFGTTVYAFETGKICELPPQFQIIIVAIDCDNEDITRYLLEKYIERHRERMLSQGSLLYHAAMRASYKLFMVVASFPFWFEEKLLVSAASNNKDPRILQMCSSMKCPTA